MDDSASPALPCPDEMAAAASGAMLQPLADELVAIAARLRDVASASPPTPSRSQRRYLALARLAYSLRRKRAAIFGNPELFGEPGWDILLDLYVAHAEGKPVSVSSACIGSAAPATTGLRWLGILADEGLIVRENDAEDNRRVLVRLTRTGITAMERFFDEMGGGL
ncbi:MarR family winged helix-turn-helix transcriptional regulator [Erythrobacter sp. sf7]|uniref:MarR family winged helix-turn-helix transcriptional regulator n=1 Tax=Erythrobacter fulvus TaxID=2987523 RepID=A0ABT5JM17_9SPHN|nr:MarR family winged helix-turn-helix transcriptional regulator [Erythrobacter fulvus]MDC8753235.1 MarR family winged helix-turn-helix transcriptional regulator [Erythrobacter fulvus]